MHVLNKKSHKITSPTLPYSIPVLNVYFQLFWIEPYILPTNTKKAAERLNKAFCGWYTTTSPLPLCHPSDIWYDVKRLGVQNIQSKAQSKVKVKQSKLFVLAHPLSHQNLTIWNTKALPFTQENSIYRISFYPPYWKSDTKWTNMEFIQTNDY